MDRNNIIIEAIHLFKTRTQVWLYDWIEDVDRWMEKADAVMNMSRYCEQYISDKEIGCEWANVGFCDFPLNKTDRSCCYSDRLKEQNTGSDSTPEPKSADEE